MILIDFMCLNNMFPCTQPLHNIPFQHFSRSAVLIFEHTRNFAAAIFLYLLTIFSAFAGPVPSDHSILYFRCAMWSFSNENDILTI